MLKETLMKDLKLGDTVINNKGVEADGIALYRGFCQRSYILRRLEISQVTAEDDNKCFTFYLSFDELKAIYKYMEEKK